ncbi:DBR1-domain-containing protein [Dipodascopsis uninucleata]
MSRTLNVAVEGCCHGELDKVYRAVSKLKTRIDLLIINGDFQAIRNHSDLHCMAVPKKYYRLGDFADYYSGKKRAPVLTIFIGGNHEASNYLSELHYGGWVAENIYFMGASNVINIKGVRIGGLSGIYSSYDYFKGHFERLPYSESTKRSIYHIRQYDVFKLYQLTGKVDVMLSHDWPAGIEHFGDLQSLLRRKKHFKSDIENKSLGSPPAWTLLKHLRPKYWFSAHLHVHYPAIVQHDDSLIKNQGNLQPTSENIPETQIAIENIDEINLDDVVDEKSTVQEQAPDRSADIPSEHGFRETRFLSLDKCVPRRKFLHVVKVPVREYSESYSESLEVNLQYDPEWLAITKSMDSKFPFTNPIVTLPSSTSTLEELKCDIKSAREWVENEIVQKNLLDIPRNFRKTAKYSYEVKNEDDQPEAYSNNQTEQFCRMLDIKNSISPTTV